MVVSDESVVHDVVDSVHLARITADKVRRDLGDAGTGAQGMGRDVGGAEGRALTPSLGAVIGGDSNNRRLE